MLTFLNIYFDRLSLILNQVLSLSIGAQISNITLYFLFFASTSVLDIPKMPNNSITDDIYNLFVPRKNSLSSANIRTPIEKWSERCRLFLIRVGRCKVFFNFKIWDPNVKKILICLEGIKIFLPFPNSEILEEQKILYPDGYPNYLNIGFKIYQKYFHFLKPLINFIAKQIHIEFREVEIYGIPTLHKVSGILTPKESSNQTPWILKQVKYLTESFHDDQKFKQRIYRDRQFVTATIDIIDIFMHSTDDTICTNISAIKLFEHTDNLASQRMNNIWGNAAVEIAGLMINLNLKDIHKPPYDGIVSIVLGGEEEYVMPCEYAVVICPPYSLDREFILSILEGMKELVTGVGGKKAASFFGSEIIENYIMPVGDLVWNDMRVGSLIHNFTAMMVSKSFQGVSKTSIMENDLKWKGKAAIIF
jgi:hypothetical protein